MSKVSVWFLLDVLVLLVVEPSNMDSLIASSMSLSTLREHSVDGWIVQRKHLLRC